jgi:hypothetical protein
LLALLSNQAFMRFKKPGKKTLIIFTIVFIVIAAVVLVVNAYLSQILEAKIRASLNENKTIYKVSLRDVKFNIISGNIKIYDLSIKPDSLALEELKNGNLSVNMLEAAEIPLFKIAGIGYYEALFNRYLEVRKVEFSKAHVTIFRGKKHKQAIKPQDDKKNFRPDSIPIEGLSGINLKKIVFSSCRFDLYDLVKDDYELQSGDIDVELWGVDIVKKEGYENVFKMGLNDFELELAVDEFKLPGGWYNLGIGKLNFDMRDSSIRIKNLKYWPQYSDLDKMARDQKFTKEIFNLTIRKMKIFQCHARGMVRGGGLLMDSILISGLDIDILKDKNYPFDETLRPKLPHQALKNMEMPLDIKNLRIENSDLKYSEKNEGQDEMMTVTLNHLSADINNITSVKDSISAGKIMEIRLVAKLMNKAGLDVQFAMPLNSRSDTMFFTGYLGPTRMKPFNKATIPALGIKFANGNIISIDFSGSANAYYSGGQMTMKYKDLEAEIFKKEENESNKFLTWVANSAARNNNPGKNGKLRVAQMQFDRVMYKGFGNFMWKTLQSGIVNTISPAGKSEKVDTFQPEEESRKSKRERRRAKNK